MKKVIACMLALLYFTASGSVAMNVHYCMGDFASVDLDTFKSDKCGKCGMEDTNTGCCHSELKVVKVDNSHKASVASVNIELPVTTLPITVSLIDESKLLSAKAEKPAVDLPPLFSPPDLYILNCVFRV